MDLDHLGVDVAQWVLFSHSFLFVSNSTSPLDTENR